MARGLANIAAPLNEPIYSYAPGSKEKEPMIAELERQAGQVVDIPLIIGGKEIRTGKTAKSVMPHDHAHVLAEYHMAGETEVQQAIQAALEAKQEWESLSWIDRAGIFMKAAQLISTKYRYILNAATMLNMSKNVFQAEIDATCELADFFRFNVSFMQQIYQDQPISTPDIFNRLEYRALEGFVFAVTPFNFTSIGGNLPTAPAIMGNTVLWKPASNAVLAAYYVMCLLREAGLPDGVINFIPGPGSVVGPLVLRNENLAGVHFTGSTSTFQGIWKTIGANIENYRTYPRIVGETGGKDFVVAHPSADVDTLATALVRGAFEFQGQKCSAASRAYIPRSLWQPTLEVMKAQMAEMKMGDPMDFGNFINALIDEPAFEKVMEYVNRAKASDSAEVAVGGGGDKSKGFFLEPTVIKTTDPRYETMQVELFAPVLTVYVYEDEKFEETLHLCDETSPYGLTGSIFARDRYAVARADDVLRHAAGNFYINDKPTGAVVGQQPFGGARASGTNDKAGSMMNLLRWTSARSVKETYCPPTDYRYPFMG